MWNLTTGRRLAVVAVLAVVAFALVFPDAAGAHNVSKRDATFVVANSGRAIVPFLYLGAKHMVTGYDHLLFLVGVIFFLYRLKDVVALRQPLHDRAQRDAAAGCPGPRPGQSVCRRRDHRLLGRVQGLRQHGWFQTGLRVSAEYEDRRADLRPVSRVRARDEAAGARAVAERAHSPTSSASTSVSKSGRGWRSWPCSSP